MTVTVVLVPAGIVNGVVPLTLKRAAPLVPDVSPVTVVSVAIVSEFTVRSASPVSLSVSVCVVVVPCTALNTSFDTFTANVADSSRRSSSVSNVQP